MLQRPTKCHDFGAIILTCSPQRSSVAARGPTEDISSHRSEVYWSILLVAIGGGVEN
ncbi:MAG: hypothetical protein ITD38_02140 [Nitrosospira sp.]|nr:hypothetical protein [Nitrosospira sp.]